MVFNKDTDKSKKDKYKKILFLDSTDSSSDIISSTTKYDETDIINVIEAFDNKNFKVVMNDTKLNLTNSTLHSLELQKKTFNEKFINLLLNSSSILKINSSFTILPLTEFY